MKDITIQKEGMTDVVYSGIKKVGTIRKFCCGTDFMPEKGNGTFSILGSYKRDEKLMECISAILSIKLPKRTFHVNFKPETALDKARLAEYEKALNKPKA